MAELATNRSVEPAFPWIGKTLVKWADAISLGGLYLAAGCLASICLLVLAEVGLSILAKLIPGVPSGIKGTWEWTGYLLGAAFLLGAGRTLGVGGHLKVTMLEDRVSAKFKSWLRIAAALIGLGITAYLAWAMIGFALRTASRGTLSIAVGTPLWIPQAIYASGLCIFAFQMLAELVVALGLAPARPEEPVHPPD